jgi:hypothetical protein
MQKYTILKKSLLFASALLASGTVFSNGCTSTIASLPLCGSVFDFCAPGDQLSLFWPYLEVPDYQADPSCTIPMGCGNSDLFPSIPGAPGGGG